MAVNLERENVEEYNIGTVASPEGKNVLARSSIVVGLSIILLVGIYVAYAASRIKVFQTTGVFDGGYVSQHYILLTRSPVIYLMFAAPFLGIFMAVKREIAGKAEVIGGKVLRHETMGTYFEHWIFMIGVTTMLVTAVLLGSPTFIHRVLVAPEAIGFGFNIHVIGVIITLFGYFYHATNRLMAGDIKEFFPSTRDFVHAFIRLGASLGLISGRHPDAGRLTPGQKISYLLWLIVVTGMLMTGAIKVGTYIVPLPPAIMGPVNYLYAFVLFLGVVLFAVHVALSLLVPYSWPRLKSVVTGFISENYAREYHAKWYQDINKH